MRIGQLSALSTSLQDAAGATGNPALVKMHPPGAKSGSESGSSGTTATSVWLVTSTSATLGPGAASPSAVVTVTATSAPAPAPSWSAPATAAVAVACGRRTTYTSATPRTARPGCRPRRSPRSAPCRAASRGAAARWRRCGRRRRRPPASARGAARVQAGFCSRLQAFGSQCGTCGVAACWAMRCST